MKIINKNILLEVKKSGEEGPFNEAQAENKEDSGYTCRFDTDDEVYYCKPPDTPKPEKKQEPKQEPKPETKQDQTQTTQSGFEKGEKEKLEKKVKEAENEAIRRHCSPWVVDNFFERDFEGKANEMAQQFVKFCEVDPRIPSSIYDYNVNLYNICAESYKDYVSKGEAHKSPFVLVMSKQKVSNSKFKDKLPNSKSMITSYEAWKSTLPTNESKIIRKKLIEHKQMKTIKETVNKKLSDKTKKVDVISENLYKVAGSFYNEKYDVFFKKIEKLTENYQKSKLFLRLKQ
jgi:hypothetical protein